MSAMQKKSAVSLFSFLLLVAFVGVGYQMVSAQQQKTSLSHQDPFLAKVELLRETILTERDRLLSQEIAPSYDRLQPQGHALWLYNAAITLTKEVERPPRSPRWNRLYEVEQAERYDRLKSAERCFYEGGLYEEINSNLTLRELEKMTDEIEEKIIRRVVRGR